MAKNPKIESLQVRRDTTENWEKRTEPLKDGEFGYDIEKDQLKMGDGESLWDDLPYFVQEEEINFATSSWSTISRVSEAGNAEKYFQIGNERTVKWNGEDVKIRIVSFNHYDKTDGSGKAGIVCQTVDVLPNVYYEIASNSDKSADGYKTTDFNQTTAKTILEGFESELVNVIKEVKINCSKGYNDSDRGYEDVEASLFLPALAEIYSEKGLNENCSRPSSQSWYYNYVDVYTNEATQYEYYQIHVGDDDSYGDTAAGKNGWYWTRTPELSNTDNWWNVSENGGTEDDAVEYTYSVAPCFCI